MIQKNPRDPNIVPFENYRRVPPHLEQALVGFHKNEHFNQSQLPGPLPGAIFEQRRSFEELARLAEQGELGEVAQNYEFLPMDVLESGNQAQLRIDGSCTAAALFGHRYARGAGPSTAVRVGRVKNVVDADGFHAYEGQIVLQELGGERAVFTATAPDESGVIQLITSEIQARAQRRHIYG
jgi:hypothetical protein